MHAWKLSGGVLAWGWLRAKGPDDSGEELDRVLNQLSNHTEERPGSGVAKTVALMAFFLHAGGQPDPPWNGLRDPISSRGRCTVAVAKQRKRIRAEIKHSFACNI